MAGFLLIQCKKKDIYFQGVPDTGEPAAVDIMIHDFTAEGYKKQKINWTLKADTSYVIYADSKIEMKNIRLVYHENPRDTSVITCQNSVMNRVTNDLTLKDDVKVKSSNGRELYTEVLYWNSKNEELFTDEPVKIIYPGGEIINGKGMKSDGSLNKIHIYKPVGVHAEHEK